MVFVCSTYTMSYFLDIQNKLYLNFSLKALYNLNEQVHVLYCSFTNKPKPQLSNLIH